MGWDGKGRDGVGDPRAGKAGKGCRVGSGRVQGGSRVGAGLGVWPPARNRALKGEGYLTRVTAM